MVRSLEMLGAETVRIRPVEMTRGNFAASVAGGFLGMILWPRHWLLGILGGSALGSNVHAVSTGRRTWKQAARRMGQHVVATAGSLAVPSHPAVAYAAAAVAADLVLDDEGHGLLSEWAHHLPGREQSGEILDADLVTDPLKQKALPAPKART